MNYNSFISLRSEEQAFHTFTYGTYLGINEEGGDIYSLYDFWVTVHENTKGFYYDAKTTQPQSFQPANILASREV
jgi:hypothetical protein